MALTFKAAAAFRWFGTHYDAGDTVDTTGYDTTDVLRLLRKAPVYVDAGGGAGVEHVAFSFAFDDAGLDTGIVVPGWQAAVGDLLVDAWIEATDQWTSEANDFCDMFLPTATQGVGAALSALAGEQTWALGRADDADPGTGTGLVTNFGLPTLSGWVDKARQDSSRYLPAKVTSAGGVTVVVSLDGTPTGGADATLTQGAATLHLLIVRA